MATPARPSQEVYTLHNLDQVKVLADPLRLEILKLFCEEPRTTKQVATLLGEKPTRLYHHVEALEKAALITLHHTLPNRGTLEKYYLAVARTFRADAGLFAAGGEEDPGWGEMSADLLETAAAQLRRLGAEDCDAVESVVVAQVSIKAPAAQVKALRQRVEDWLQELQDFSDGEDDEDLVEYSLALALFPVPGEGESSG